ncbi:MAG: hypothetical protein KDI46_04480 [Alphaproteobacteria bacterium]|nr:hypothetical protein [Alphaproteobacteria bacterium]
MASGINWRSFKKLANPRVADDLNVFLEKLPQNTNKTMLIILGAVWATAAATGLYTTVQLQELTALRTKLAEGSALKPAVPQIQDMAVNGAEVENFVKNAKDVYTGLDIKASGSTVLITASTTAAFGQFREAIGHIQNGGSGWRVSIERLCVGRECDKYPLAASLRINKVSVNTPG